MSGEARRHAEDARGGDTREREKEESCGEGERGQQLRLAASRAPIETLAPGGAGEREGEETCAGG